MISIDPLLSSKQQLLKETAHDDPDFAMREKALNQFKVLADFVNKKIQEAQDKMKIIEVESQIYGLEEDLVQPHRLYRFEGKLRRVMRASVHVRQVFVFNDCILLCRTNKGNSSRPYRIVGFIHLNMKPFPWARSDDAIDDTKRTWRLIHANETFIFRAQTEKAKNEWLRGVNQVLNDILDTHPDYMCLFSKQNKNRNSLFNLKQNK